MQVPIIVRSTSAWVPVPVSPYAADVSFSVCIVMLLLSDRPDGSPVCWFGRTAIHSRASMTYDQVGVVVSVDEATTVSTAAAYSAEM